ncbi:esterase [Steroidobacter denitrificans]|uniref:Esterase n=1 Tax=Steroidobacter denitrificans TaxID=465721 RepID=A0A127F759_STEDE|nr:MFS transporter [Steroidobacter denitrificans]AMN46237.1 esterase [Steroidobacter denitrificans]
MQNSSSLRRQTGIFHGWWIVGVALLAQAITTGLVIYSYGLLVMPIGTEFGANRFEMMWGKTGLSLMTILVSPFFGTLLDRYSARLLMTLGVLALSSTFIWISISSTLWEFVFAFAALSAVAMALLGTLGTSVLVTRWFRNKRGRALSLTALGSSIGGLFIPYLFQVLIDTFGWRTACAWFGAGTAVLLLPLVFILVRNRPADLGLYPDGTVTTTEVAAQALSEPTSVDGLLLSKRFWQLAIAIGAVFAVSAALLVNIVPYAQGQGIVSQHAALLISAYAISGIGGKLLFSLIADRVDLKMSLQIAMALLVPPIVTLTQTDTYKTMLICSVLLGMVSGALMPGWTALLAHLYGPIHYGRVMGRMLPVTGVMATVIVPLVGYLFDRSGNYNTAFFCLATFVIIAIVLLVSMREK